MNSGNIVIYGTILISCLSIGAYLVVNNHPWFGLLAMAIGAGLRFTTSDKDR